MDVHDFAARLAVGERDAYDTVEAAGTQQRLVEDIGAVGGPHYRDVAARGEAVEFTQQLHQRALYFTVAGGTHVHPLGADGVEFIDEDNARRTLLRHGEEFAHQPCPLADVLLYQLAADEPDETGLGGVGHCLRQQRLAAARRPHKQYPLGRVNTYLSEERRVEHRQFHSLAQLVELFLQAPDVGVGFGGFLHHLGPHHQWILGAGEYVEYRQGLAVQRDPVAGAELRPLQVLGLVYHEVGAAARLDCHAAVG